MYYQPRLGKEQKVTSSETKPKTQNTLAKELIIAVLSVLSAVVSWWLVVRILNNDFWHFDQFNILRVHFDIITLSVVLILVLCLNISFMLFLIILSRSWISLVTIVIIAFMPVVFYLTVHNIVILFAGAFVYFLGMFGWSLILRRAFKNQVNFSLMSVLRPGLSLVIIVVLINISLLYYVNFTAEAYAIENLENSTITYTVHGINKILSGVMDGYSQTITVDEFIVLLGSSRIGGKNKTDNNEILGSLEDVLKDFSIDDNGTAGFIEEQKASARENFFASLGLADAGLTGKTPMDEVWYQYINNKITPTLSSFDRFIPWIVALGLFFSLMIFKFVYKLFIVAISWLILKVLLMANFFRWKEESITVRHLSLQ